MLVGGLIRMDTWLYEAAKQFVADSDGFITLDDRMAVTFVLDNLNLDGARGSGIWALE